MISTVTDLTVQPVNERDIAQLLDAWSKRTRFGQKRPNSFPVNLRVTFADGKRRNVVTQGIYVSNDATYIWFYLEATITGELNDECKNGRAEIGLIVISKNKPTQLLRFYDPDGREATLNITFDQLLLELHRTLVR
jgi:hypothetical protein